MTKKTLSTPKPWWVYIIETEKGTLYTGVTVDLKRRLEQHQGKLAGGAKFFSTSPAVGVRFKKRCPSRSEAQKLEAKIKKVSREAKLALIAKRVKKL